MIPLWMIHHFKTPMPRRNRPIGEHQTALGRFLKLRRPWGLPKREKTMRFLRRVR